MKERETAGRKPNALINAEQTKHKNKGKDPNPVGSTTLRRARRGKLSFRRKPGGGGPEGEGEAGAHHNSHSGRKVFGFGLFGFPGRGFPFELLMSDCQIPVLTKICSSGKRQIYVYPGAAAG